MRSNYYGFFLCSVLLLSACHSSGSDTGIQTVPDATNGASSVSSAVASASAEQPAVFSQESTDGWITDLNPKYKFAFKYPPNWVVRDEHISQSCATECRSWFNFLLLKKPTSSASIPFEAGNYGDYAQVSVSVDPLVNGDIKSLNQQEWIATYKAEHDPQWLQIGSVKTLYSKYKGTDNGPGWLYEYDVFQGDAVYSFEYTTLEESEDEAMQKTIQTIVSTLKFDGSVK